MATYILKKPDYHSIYDACSTLLDNYDREDKNEDYDFWGTPLEISMTNLLFSYLYELDIIDDNWVDSLGHHTPPEIIEAVKIRIDKYKKVYDITKDLLNIM